MDVLDMIAAATPHHRLLHPPCQPDELQKSSATDRRALGIHL